jgi:hypothetical protein
MKILKYQIPEKFFINEPFQIIMPADSVVLSFQVQENNPFIWALVDEGLLPQRRNFYLFGTGHEIKNHEIKKYIGTIQIERLVWHLFEETKNDM